MGALAELDLSDESWEELCASGGASKSELDAYGGTADVDDAFYQWKVPQLASWFGIDEQLNPLDFGVDTVWDDDVGNYTTVRDGELMYPVFEAMAMGWTWALHFCNESVAAIAEDATGGAAGDTRLVREKVLPPTLAPGRTIAAVYVDNYTVIGGGKEDTEKALHSFRTTAQGREVGVHGDLEVSKYFDSLGVSFDLENKIMRHKVRRIWKVCLAGRALARRRRVHLSELQAWTGHVVHIFSLCRPALAALQVVYSFIEELRTGPKALPSAVVAEILLCSDLVFLVEHSMDTAYWPEVFCTDSSDYAWAILRIKPGRKAIRDIGKYRERWRVIEVEQHDETEHVLPSVVEAASGRLAVGGDAPSGIGKCHASVDVRGQRGSAMGPQTKFGKWAQNEVEQSAKRKSRSTPVARPRKTEEVGIRLAIPPLPRMWGEREWWKPVLAQKRKHPEEHINLKEGRTSLRCLRRVARCADAQGTTLVTIGDNLVSICAFEKGRSKAWGLNAVARRSAAYQIGCRIQWRQRHIESERCVADAGSRLADPGFGHTQAGGSSSSKNQPAKIHWSPAPAAPKISDDSQWFSNMESVPSEERVHLELFSGTGVQTSAMHEAGLRTLRPMELKAKFDLSRRSTQLVVLQWIRSGRIWSLHAGTPCTIWSIARRGIKNLKRAADKERLGVELALFTVEVIRECSRCGVIWTLENPASSGLFRYEPIAALQSLPNFRDVHFHMCAFGAAHRKPTRIWTNASCLESLEHRCDGQHRHEILAGKVRQRENDGTWKWKSRTELAGEYPQQLVERWAALLSSVAPISAFGADAQFDEEWESDLAACVPSSK